MRTLMLALVKLLPWLTRYFVVSNASVDHIAPGLATLIRKRGRSYSYLYMAGEMSGPIEAVPDTTFFWGPWLRVNMRKHAPVVREIDEQECFVMVRAADANLGNRPAEAYNQGNER